MLKSRHRSGLNLQVKIVIRVYNVALNMTNIGELLFVFGGYITVGISK